MYRYINTIEGIDEQEHVLADQRGVHTITLGDFFSISSNFFFKQTKGACPERKL